MVDRRGVKLWFTDILKGSDAILVRDIPTFISVNSKLVKSRRLKSRRGLRNLVLTKHFTQSPMLKRLQIMAFSK